MYDVVIREAFPSAISFMSYNLLKISHGYFHFPTPPFRIVGFVFCSLQQTQNTRRKGTTVYDGQKFLVEVQVIRNFGCVLLVGCRLLPDKN